MKARGLWPRAFICFSVFGTRDEALALVFDILLTKVFLKVHSINVFDGVTLSGWVGGWMDVWVDGWMGGWELYFNTISKIIIAGGVEQQ